MEKQDISVSDMEELGKLIKEAREYCDQKAAEKAEAEGQLLALEMKAISYLTALDLTSYKSANGTMTVTTRASYKLPKTWENKQALFDYLKEKGLYEEAVSVNSQWLNGFCKREVEAATEAGDLFFSVPGIEYSPGSPNLSFRKK